MNKNSFDWSVQLQRPGENWWPLQEDPDDPEPTLDDEHPVSDDNDGENQGGKDEEEV